MPRSANKGKRDKQKVKSTAKEITPSGPEQEEEDLIAGHISRAQWTDMLIQEDADEIVGEIMDELLCQIMDGCYKSYIEKQQGSSEHICYRDLLDNLLRSAFKLAPHTASWAKSYLTKIVECQVLCLDQGEETEEMCMTEDSEPMPAIPDCWAQGCVPTANAESKTHCGSQQEVGTDQSLKKDETEKKHREDEKDPSCTVPSLPANTEQQKIIQVTKPPKYPRRKVLPSVFSSTEKKNVEIKGEHRDSVAHKVNTAPVYHHKDPQPIPKLDPKCLPQHRIFPQYEIVDNDLTKPSPAKSGGLPRLEAKLKKQKPKTETSPKPPKTISKEPPDRFQIRSKDDIRLAKPEKQRQKLFGPLKLDTMILVNNVSLLDSQAAESTPLRMSYPSQATGLNPIQSDVTVPVYSVDQVASGPLPQVKPITQSKSL